VSFCKTLEKEISLGIKDGDFVQGMTTFGVENDEIGGQGHAVAKMKCGRWIS
jgi:hypothetical protein